MTLQAWIAVGDGSCGSAECGCWLVLISETRNAEVDYFAIDGTGRIVNHVITLPVD